MLKPNSKQPLNWEDYEYGRSPRNGSNASLDSHVQFDEPSPSATSGRLNLPHRDSGGSPSHGDLHDLRPRRYDTSLKVIDCRNIESSNANESFHSSRSSLSMRVSSWAHAGGANSLENFARSWSRAAGFAEIPTQQPSFVITPEDEETTPQPRQSPPSAQSRSLLREQLQREGTSSQAVLDEDSTKQKQYDDAPPPRDVVSSTPQRTHNILDQAPYLASPFASSYGGIYGSLSSRANSSSMRHAGELFRQQQEQGRQEPDKEQEPLLVKVVEQKDGSRVPVVIGRSTLPQTVFNSVNVLVGVGLLSLPLGLKYSGWLVGMLFLFFAAIITRYTAGVLAKCLDVNPVLIGFADVAYQAFGRNATIATGFLFTIELLAACVALVVLFADSLDDLIPDWGVITWKIVAGLVLAPLSFVPLRYLSFTSVLGIICCLGSMS